MLFKPQLVRLLGTAQLTLLHAMLALKAAFEARPCSLPRTRPCSSPAHLGCSAPALPLPIHLLPALVS